MSNFEETNFRPETIEDAKAPIRGPRLNLAIGPNCPVRCEGCYNNFGETFTTGGIVATEEIVDFASAVRERGIDGVTLSGGDPLFHPEIQSVLHGLKELDFRIKVDTVGTALLADSRIIYKGRGGVPRVAISSIKDTLESVTIPLDGTNQETIENFRKGRKNILEETKTIAQALGEAGVDFGFNTVVHAKNMHQIAEIGRLAHALGAFEWHVFEYDSNGPNPSNQKESLRISYGEFEAATAALGQLPIDGMRLDLRTRESRIGAGAYFFVNDAGEAWSPNEEGGPTKYGHISRNREAVLSAYDNYLTAFGIKFQA